MNGVQDARNIGVYHRCYKQLLCLLLISFHFYVRALCSFRHRYLGVTFIFVGLVIGFQVSNQLLLPRWIHGHHSGSGIRICWYSRGANGIPGGTVSSRTRFAVVYHDAWSSYA